MGWKLLKNLVTKSDLSWVVMGDFNDITRFSKKESGNQTLVWLIRGFFEAISDVELNDLGKVGKQFTWARRLGP